MSRRLGLILLIVLSASVYVPAGAAPVPVHVVSGAASFGELYPALFAISASALSPGDPVHIGFGVALYSPSSGYGTARIPLSCVRVVPLVPSGHVVYASGHGDDHSDYFVRIEDVPFPGSDRVNVSQSRSAGTPCGSPVETRPAVGDYVVTP